MSFSYLAVDFICLIELGFLFFKTFSFEKRTTRHIYFLHLLGFSAFYTIVDGLLKYAVALHDLHPSFTYAMIPITQIYAYICIRIWFRYVLCYTESKYLYNYVLQVLTCIPLLVSIVTAILIKTGTISYNFEKCFGLYTYSIKWLSILFCVMTFVLFAGCIPFTVSFLLKKFKSIERNHAILFFALSVWPLIVYPLLFKYTDSPVSTVILLFPCIGSYFISISESRKKSLLIKKQKTFLENILKREQISNHVINSVAKMFLCIYYINLKEDSFMEVTTAEPEIHNLIGSGGSAKNKLKSICNQLVSTEHKKEMEEFVNLQTLSKRMNERPYLSTEFFGPGLGWCEAIFIPSSRTLSGDITHVILTIHSIKKEKELLFRSNTDALTGLLNRRAYEEYVSEHRDFAQKDDFVLFAFDLNGLKTVNDKIGHAAGDEFILGAAECMKKTFGKFGAIYRTGGDEFFAILSIDSLEKINSLKNDFNFLVKSWHGKYVNSISVSTGFVRKQEFPSISISELAKIADQRMYNEKAAYYSNSGNDRRGPKVALENLKIVYEKIVTVNLATDSYQIVKLNDEEKIEAKGFRPNYSSWTKEFALAGNVFKDDVLEFIEKTETNFLRNYFAQQKTTILTHKYRRIFNAENEYKNAIMDIIPAKDFSLENQILHFYIREV